MIDAVAPSVVGVAIAGIDPAAWKDVGAAHERRALMPPDHEDFRTRRTIPEHDDG
jgi:hypothetical protein